MGDKFIKEKQSNNEVDSRYLLGDTSVFKYGEILDMGSVAVTIKNYGSNCAIVRSERFYCMVKTQDWELSVYRVFGDGVK